MDVVVAGGGVAGMSAALAVARSGSRVCLVERDDVSVPGGATAAPSWERKGIPHFQQPHALLPRGRNQMLLDMPDVYDALIKEGADPIDLWQRIPGGRPAGEDDVHYFAARRPLIEWALRRAVLSEPGVTVVPKRRVTGVVGNGRVEGVRLDDGSELRADLVVDAMGRRSPLQEWLSRKGAEFPATVSGECGMLYYSRYFRLRPGRVLPDGPWLTGPRADLGYAGCATFYGDNRTFATALVVPVGDRALRIVKDEAAYVAVLQRVPSIAAWVDLDIAEPITPVLPMANLQNTLRTFTRDGEPVVAGVVAVADAICHTDPGFALGLSFSIIHGSELAAAIRDHPNDVRDLAARYFTAIEPEMLERHTFAVEASDLRERRLQGEQFDPSTPASSKLLFVAAATALLATRDAEIGRRALRRWGFLDPISAIDDDARLLARMQTLLAQTAGDRPPAPQGPSRDEVLEIARAALARGGAAE